ncbi:hypothetical protein ACFQPA_00780 [Halomarina halobia]|uniref:Cox cluster protein n=1 Tax=Halomarina halobia TaxID=3033386 RepID=A0ABD6A7T5_9EURY|nr:hypothetical protein [Halomarina sp. PSR21]
MADGREGYADGRPSPSDPDGLDDPGGRAARARTTRAYVDDGDLPAPDEAEFGLRGWLLVGMILVAFVVAPALVLYIPYSGPLISALGLTFRDAYLTIPLVPALLLGALAVWAAVGSRRA